jgi:hypothetical protein
VDGSGLGEARHAGVGQRDDDTTSVRIGVGSPDEASSTNRATRLEVSYLAGRSRGNSTRSEPS